MLEKILGFVNMGLWICLFISMFFSYLRGFRKSVSRLISTVVVIILSFVFTNAICKSLTTTNFGALIGQGNMNFASLIEELIKDLFEIKTIANDSALKEFCLAASEAFIKIPIFFGFYSVLIIIFRPLIALIIRVLFPLPEGKSVSMRFASMGIGVFTFFIVIWFWFFPVLGSKGVVQQCVEYYNAVIVDDSKMNISNEKTELEEIEDALELFDDGSFVKALTIFSGENNNLEAKLLGRVTTIKTSNGDLNFVTELENIMPVLKILENARFEDENILIQYLLNNKDLILDALETSQVINVMFPIAIEILDYTVEEFNVEGLKDTIWTDEKVNLINAIRVILNAVVELKINFNDPIKVLDNPNFSTQLSEIGKALEKSELIKFVVTFYLNDYLHEILKGEFGDEHPVLLEVLDLTKINLENDLYIVGNVLTNAKKLGIFDNDIKIIENKNSISQMIKSIFMLSTIKGNESRTIEAVLDMAGLNEKLEEAGIVINLNISNWENEIENLTKVLELILTIAEENSITSFEEINIIELMEKAIDSSTFDQLIDHICSSEIYNKTLINIVNSVLEKNELSNIKSDKFNQILNGTLPLDVGVLKFELKLLLKETSGIVELLNSETIDVLKVKNIILNLCESTYIKVQEIVSMVFDEFINENNIFEKQIVLIELSNNEWKAELNSIFDIIDKIQANNYLDEDFSFELDEQSLEEILDLIDLMNKSDIFRQILPDLISKVISEKDFLNAWLLSQCGINDYGSNKVVASKNEWNTEISKFRNIHSYYMENNVGDIDFDNMNDEDYSVVRNLFLKMNNTNICDMNGIVSSVNESLVEYEFNFQIIGISDRNNDGSCKDEWELEIPRMIECFKMFNEIEEINNEVLKSKHHQIGTLLETLKYSYVFGNDTRNDGSITTDDNIFNHLIISVLDSVNLIKNGKNPNGFIDENKANLTDWNTYDWISEIEILSSFDVNVDAQSIDTIKQISNSKIVKDFFDIATFLNDELDGKKMVISKGSFSYTLVLKDLINNGNPFTNDQLKDLDWALELESVDQITDVFDAGYTPTFKAEIEEIIALNNGTFAVRTAISIKLKLQFLTYGGTSVWDII